MLRRDITIELCACAETIGIDTDETMYTDAEVVGIFWDAARVRLEAAGFTKVIEPRGQRRLHHGWRGAHARHGGGGLLWLTYDHLTPAGERAIDQAVSAAYDEAAAAISAAPAPLGRRQNADPA